MPSRDESISWRSSIGHSLISPWRCRGSGAEDVQVIVHDGEPPTAMAKISESSCSRSSIHSWRLTGPSLSRKARRSSG